MTEVYTQGGDGGANLLHLYDRESTLEPMERNKPLFYKELKAVPNVSPGGLGLTFTVVGAKGHGVGLPGETGEWSKAHTRQQTSCTVTSAQIDSVVDVSMKYEEAASGQGSFTGNADDDLVLEAMDSLLSYADTLLGAGRGTSQLGEVLASTVTSDTFVCALTDSDGAYKLRENMPVEFVDGLGVVRVQSVITHIDYDAQEVTLEDVVSLTAGWSIHKADTYGQTAPNGVLNLVDDGRVASTVYDKSRTDFPYLNATIIDHGLQDYSDEAVDKLLSQVTYKQDLIPTQIRSNRGMALEYKANHRADLTFLQQPGGPPPDYQGGMNIENLAYVFGTVKIAWKVDTNLPARNIYALYLPSWGRCVLREPDWVKIGNNNFLLKPAAGGDGWTYQLTGSLMMDITIRDKKPRAQGALINVKDRFAAGLEDAA